MSKKLLLFVALAANANASETTSVSHFSELSIDAASPTGVFQRGQGGRAAVGIGAELESEYHGSAKRITELMPYIELSYRSKRWEFQSNIMNNRVIYQLNNAWYVASWLNLEEGREAAEASDNSLDGMGDIDDMFEVGAGVSWRATDDFTLSLMVQGYAGGDPDKGMVGFIFAHYRILRTDSWKVDLSADLSFADSKHLTTEFGVTPQQSKTSAYEVYEIDNGLKSIGVGINSVYALNKNILISLNADYELLLSDSADSPLIKAGSDIEIEAGASVIYRF